jgi:hypothetical protein
MRGEPDLVADNGHHEEKIKPERPEDGEFAAFELTAGDRVFFGGHELIVFE